MKLAIVIPVYLNTLAHQKYLIETTRSISTSYEWIFIPVINRYTQEKKSWEFIQQPNKTIELEGRQPQSVSKAWNDGISRAFEEECDYTLILNADIILDKKAIDNIVAYAETKKWDNFSWTMMEHKLPEKINEQSGYHYFSHPDFAAFLVDKSFTQIIGKFDENFTPAYFEDLDIFARIIKMGKQIDVCSNANFFHYGSKTINSDPDYLNGHHLRFERNKAYFRGKWGNEPIWIKEEILKSYYETPFNKPNLHVNFWQ